MDETYDFVVVGSGGGSMCAGLVMRKAGKSVLVLEKTDLLGGSTAKPGGVMCIPNNRLINQFPDRTDFCLSTGGCHQHSATSVRNGGPEESHTEAVAKSRCLVIDRIASLRYGVRLTRQRRFFDLQSRVIDDPAIGGHSRPGRQDD